MSSEFSCDYCSVCPRHPCDSREEAAQCQNADNRASYLDFSNRDVAAWLRNTNQYGLSEEQKAHIESVCHMLDENDIS